jgi:hypothetical protein
MKDTRSAARTSAHNEAPVSELPVVVPYTTPGLTRTALNHIAALGGELGANVRLIDAHVVPFPVPVAKPTVSVEFLDQRLYAAAEELRLPVRMELLLTRDRLDAFRKALEPGSLVVIATRGWWWFSAEKRLARSLSKAGYDVMLVR